jgi:hypothetical protein
MRSGFFDAENDLLQLLDLRTVAGAGAGAHLFKSDMTQVNLFGGVSYARDNYTEVTTTDTSTTTTTTTGTTPGGPPTTTPGKGGTPPGQGGTPPGQTRVSRGGTPPDVVRTSLNRNVGEFLIGQDLTRQLSGNVGVSEALTVFPAVSDLADYRVSFDFTVWAQLNGWLQWNASVADRYLHIPPAGGAVQNDTFVWTGLGITFGRATVAPTPARTAAARREVASRAAEHTRRLRVWTLRVHSAVRRRHAVHGLRARSPRTRAGP